MNALNIYRNALEQLASQGNAEARMALQIGLEAEQETSKPDRSDVQRICAFIRDADDYLARALRHNDYEWTGKTDREIENARSSMRQALTFLATK